MPGKLPFLQALSLARALVRVRLLRRPTPLFCGWNVTFRCNLRCKYCGACDAPRDELSTAEMIERLDGLRELGTRWITFGGGEPLMRRDMPDILEAAHRKGFNTFLSTNGWLLPERREVLQWVQHVNMSLDGTRETHDAVRGAGAFDKAIEAAVLCRESGVPASFQCVLSSFNLGEIEDVVRIAREQSFPVMFQPATRWLDTSTAPNPIAPPVEEYRRAMTRLIELKKQGAPIRNSVSGLRHLAAWPDPKAIWCSAGLLSFTIEPDGYVLACHQAQVGAFLQRTPQQGGVSDRYRAMPIPQGCRLCWCAPVVEMALVFSLNPGAVWNAFRTAL